MGDSTCLMQPFCYASGLTNEANESNPIHALGQSVSFGRFVSESLAWEKWSSFSHNRYVEEAERHSRPGSVAQKKAFFEAHYKKLAAQKAAAAALLEQANNAATQNNATGQEDEGVAVNNSNGHASETTNNATGQEDEGLLDSNSSVHEEQGLKLEARHVISDPGASGHGSGTNVVEGAEPEMEPQALVGNSTKIELQNQLEDVDPHRVQAEKISATPPIMTPILKGSNSDQQVLASIGKKKPSVSSFKLLKASGTSKVASTPARSAVPASCKRDNIATPTSNKHAGLSSADKKRYTPKSLQMSVNFTPIRELNRLTASVMRRFESARAAAAGSSSKASKDALTPLRTPTMASKKEMQKHSSLTPLTERRRNKTPLDLSSRSNHTGGPRWRLPASENKMKSPIIISSPFSLRTEERAARRQKKLEEKFNANNEAQKVQLHTKLKEKAETEIRKLRQSLCFKARPLPDFYKERKASNNDTKKDPLTHSEPTKEGRKPTPSVLEKKKTLLPPHRPSLKNNGTKYFQGKSGHTLAHENTPPNIQLGNRNDGHRYYK